MPDTPTPINNLNPDTSALDPREVARRALEGAEHTEKRTAEEEMRSARERLDALNKRLGEIKTQKEKLELAWIELDGKKKTLRTVIAPFLDQEKKLEEEEAKLETEEAGTGVPASRHEVEAKRWTIQQERQKVETEKWTEEKRVVELDAVIEQNTKQYRVLLAEEDKLTAELEQLKAQHFL